MTAKRKSPSRRNSFAVANKTQEHPGRRRRAHSIAPGDRQSPATKARRSLAPRKSILKAAVNIADADADDATQSMDITRDYRDDNLTRKSLGRRVSFANHAHVRLFEVPDHNTNSTTSPQSSPAVEPDFDSPWVANDENAYPGAQKSRRRSSARRSMAISDGGGEESMDMDSDDTGFSPSAFFRAAPEGSMDNEFDDLGDQSEGDNMDVTEVVPRNFVRTHSLSLGVPRQPLANLSIPQSPADAYDGQQNETSYVEEGSLSQSFTSEDDVSQPMEFTVPLIRPSEPPTKEWLALRSATHSGDTPFVPSSDDDGANDGEDIQEMELTDAVSRLQAARASLGLGEPGDGGVDHSFTSTEDSFMDEDGRPGEDGNQTVNVTQLMKRVSLGQSADSTMSMFGSQEQTREEAINQTVPGPSSPTPLASSQRIYPALPGSPPPSGAAISQASHTDVSANDTLIASAPATTESTSLAFSVPQPMASEAQPVPSESLPRPQLPLNFTFTPKPPILAPPVRSRPSSPVKAPPSPKKFTAAFAPPIARPSPRKQSNDVLVTDHGVQPSPAKRSGGTERLSITPGRGTGAVRVLLSPSKTSPLKTTSLHTEEQYVAGLSTRPPIDFRRPSDYIAQRKSLGGSAPDSTLALSTGVTLPTRLSPPKKGVFAQGRRSTGFPIGSTENGDGEDTMHRRWTSPTRATGLEGQEKSTEHPSPLGNVSMHRSPRRKSLAFTLGEEDAQSNHDDEPEDDATGPPISIEQFFEMTGIRFMDDIAAPRRSIVHPSALRPSRRTSMEAQIPLAEYVVAMAVNVPQLELYSHVSKDLQAWVERIKEIHRDAEEEALKATPPLFQEFVSTDESGQAELLHQLKLIKAYNHAQAKSEWYDWKMQWVEQLYQNSDEGFKSLEADAKVLEEIIQQAQNIVPGLQQEYDDLMAELAKEKAEVAELEGYDQDYLNELKVTIAEQGAELDTFHADVKEAKTKLDRLEEKLNEVKSQTKEVTSVVEDAERRIHMQKTSTRAEILQLKDELEALQSLHMLKATKVLPELFEFTYASSYCVSIPCIKFRPVVANIQIKRTENVKTKHKEVSPVLSALMLRTAHQLVMQHGDQNIRPIVQRLGDYWYPLSVEETPAGFTATATVLFPIHEAKALISFIIDTPVFSSWPMLIQSIRCDVKVAYGSIDRDIIYKIVSARLRQASPLSNHGCLLDSCMETVECMHNGQDNLLQ